jgi:hypothetical protein
MQRQCLSWVASLLLLLAQHGALLHELGHLSHVTRTAGATLQADGHALEGAACPTCVAFSQVANPAAGGASNLAASLPGITPAPDPCYAIVAAGAPIARSRGPPQA